MTFFADEVCLHLHPHVAVHVKFAKPDMDVLKEACPAGLKSVAFRPLVLYCMESVLLDPFGAYYKSCIAISTLNLEKYGNI